MRVKLLIAGVGLFAAAFVGGSLLRVDKSAAAKQVRERLAALGGPHFPEGDTLVVADTLHARCGTKPAGLKAACYRPQLMSLREQRGTRFAMGTLNRLTVLDHDVAYTGHDYAHAMGIAAFKASQDVTSSFTSCTEILQSGCYHGVIQTYLVSVKHVGADEVNAVCHEWAVPGGDRWLRFQCVHGMGHGLEMYLAHDLPKALAGCDLLRDEWDRKSCYGGAFMENIIFATDPTMAKMVMGDAHGGHDMEMPATSAFKLIDRADPYYPCSVLGEVYQQDCWEMQPAVMLQIYEGDFEKTFKACDLAPVRWRPECYQGVGTEISGGTVQDHESAISYCSRGAPHYQPWCYLGVVKNFIDVTAKSADGMAFCKKVPARANQLKCYEAVGEEIAVMRNTLEARRPMCEVIVGDAGALDACLYGAQILRTRPRGIPVAD